MIFFLKNLMPILFYSTSFKRWLSFAVLFENVAISVIKCNAPPSTQRGHGTGGNVKCIKSRV